METTEKPNSLDALPQYLVEHDNCSKGFDVTHPEGLGAGVISMKCRSCGKSFEFVPTTVEVEREVSIERLADDPVELQPETAAKRSLQSPAKTTDDDRRDRDLPRKRRSARSTRDRVVVAVLLAFAIAAFAFAIFRVLSEKGDSNEPEVASTTPTTAAAPPATREAPQPGPQAAAKPATPAPKPAPQTRLLQLPEASISVPADWSKARVGDFTAIGPTPGPRVVSIRIYNETNPSLSGTQMIAGTRDFLKSQAPNGSPLAVRRATAGGAPAFRTGERGPRGIQQALGVLAGPRRYLLIGSADPAATGAERAQMARALKSFRPN